MGCLLRPARPARPCCDWTRSTGPKVSSTSRTPFNDMALPHRACRGAEVVQVEMCSSMSWQEGPPCHRHLHLTSICVVGLSLSIELESRNSYSIDSGMAQLVQGKYLIYSALHTSPPIYPSPVKPRAGGARRHPAAVSSVNTYLPSSRRELVVLTVLLAGAVQQKLISFGRKTGFRGPHVQRRGVRFNEI